MNLLGSITFIVVLVFLQAPGIIVTEIYVGEGNSVNLTCPMKIEITSLTWRGPPNRKIYSTRSSEVHIRNVRVIHVDSTGENILEISKFEANNEGVYQCTSLYGEYSFNLRLLRTPNVSIVNEINVSDNTLVLTCMASGGVPDNYTYEWEHRTDANDHIRFLPSEPTIRIKNDPFQSVGLYVCTVFGSFESITTTDSQSTVYHLNISAVPRFASNNTPEHYINFNRPNDFKVYYVAYPIANITVLEDNKSDLGLRRCDMCISVNKATVADIIHNKLVKVIGYEINIRIFIGNRLYFSNITVVLQNDRGWSNYTIKVKAAKRHKAPAHIKAIALETKIILKWRADLETSIKTPVFVEYCKYFESEWSQVSAKSRSTAVIDGLEPDTVYFLRLYFKTVTGEKSRTDTVIVKTEKVRILVTEFALLFETLLLVICMCWCGLKAPKKRQCRNNNRVTPSQRNEEPSVRAHYDEINSIYYNPINVTISPQSTSSNAHFENCQPSISNAIFENNESDTNNSSNQLIITGKVDEIISSHGNSSRSPTDESYFVPCRTYIDFEHAVTNENCESNIDEPEIPVEESSISSNNSETNMKCIRRYETLNVTDREEHYYDGCN